mmetsp:Transcript_43688/g.132923  ORF Transcript_43688/g.132923 Transcript_43688/m.132923 type:complete len:519 (-) Transcript_43688:594-2150(-)
MKWGMCDWRNVQGWMDGGLALLFPGARRIVCSNCWDHPAGNDTDALGVCACVDDGTLSRLERPCLADGLDRTGRDVQCTVQGASSSFFDDGGQVPRPLGSMQERRGRRRRRRGGGRVSFAASSFRRRGLFDAVVEDDGDVVARDGAPSGVRRRVDGRRRLSGGGRGGGWPLDFPLVAGDDVDDTNARGGLLFLLLLVVALLLLLLLPLLPLLLIVAAVVKVDADGSQPPRRLEDLRGTNGVESHRALERRVESRPGVVGDRRRRIVARFERAPDRGDGHDARSHRDEGRVAHAQLREEGGAVEEGMMNVLGDRRGGGGGGRRRRTLLAAAAAAAASAQEGEDGPDQSRGARARRSKAHPRQYLPRRDLHVLGGHASPPGPDEIARAEHPAGGSVPPPRSVRGQQERRHGRGLIRVAVVPAVGRSVPIGREVAVQHAHGAVDHLAGFADVIDDLIAPFRHPLPPYGVVGGGPFEGSRFHLGAEEEVIRHIQRLGFDGCGVDEVGRGALEGHPGDSVDDF